VASGVDISDIEFEDDQSVHSFGAIFLEAGEEIVVQSTKDSSTG
jgi:hypothetical protein